MIDTNLILIDGLPGSGKSTTAQRLYLFLVKNGFKVSWFAETSVPHPIFGSESTRELVPREDRKPELLSNWSALLDEIGGTDQVCVLESTLFQNIAGTMHWMGIGRDEIVDFILETEALIAPLKPVFIYFYQSDVSAAFQAIASQRGLRWAAHMIRELGQTPLGLEMEIDSFEKVIAYYVDQKALGDALFSQLAMPKLGIENDAGLWDRYLERIADFLALADLQASDRPAPRLDDYSGRFKETQSGEICVVSHGETALFLGEGQETRLLHKSDDVFCVESVPVDLEFLRSSDGRVERLRCAGNLPEEPMIGTVWQKLQD